MEQTVPVDVKAYDDLQRQDSALLYELAGYLGSVIDRRRDGAAVIEGYWTDLADYIDRHRDLMDRMREAIGLAPLRSSAPTTEDAA